MTDSKRPGPLVLVVDDHKDLRGILVEILEDERYEVVSASNGQEALDALRRGLRPALILLDLRMPVMDGWEFLRLRRDEPDLARIPVLALSAGTPRKAPDRSDGVVAVLPKPISADELCQAVARAIANHGPDSTAG